MTWLFPYFLTIVCLRGGAMTERGILFTPENYGKCEVGTKTQTRRIIKPEWWNCLDPEDEDDRTKAVKQCPYGTVGDRLYVKEGLERRDMGVRYRRDKVTVAKGEYAWEWQRDTLSPMHMPKWAARLWMELTDVRVERVQDISEEDAKAEGVSCVDLPTKTYEGWADAYHRLLFKALWESIYGKDSWDLNPWVWVLEFNKL